MQNRNEENIGNRKDKDFDNDLNREPSRSPGSDSFGSSSGRSGLDQQSDVNDVSRRKDISDENVDRGSMRGGSGSSEGEH